MSTDHLKIYTRLPKSIDLTIDQLKEIHVFYGPRTHITFVGTSDQYPNLTDLNSALDEIRKAFPKYTINYETNWFLCVPSR